MTAAIDWAEEADRLIAAGQRDGTLIGYSFRWNRRTHAAGLCNYAKRTIELSAVLTPHRKDSDILDTLLHEVAHAMAGPWAGHGPQWKAQARALGARPAACIADTAAMAPVIAASRRYVARCDRCGTDIGGRMKAPDRNRTYRHKSCGSPVTWRINAPAEKRT